MIWVISAYAMHELCWYTCLSPKFWYEVIYGAVLCLIVYICHAIYVCMCVWCMCVIKRPYIIPKVYILSNNQACDLPSCGATYLIASCPAAWIMHWDHRYHWSNIPTVKRSMSYQNKRWLFSARKMHVLNNILHALISPLQLHVLRSDARPSSCCLEK